MLLVYSLIDQQDCPWFECCWALIFMGNLTKKLNFNLSSPHPLGKRFDHSANYDQSNIFESSKIWTAFQKSTRRGNYEDLDWTGGSFLDPLQLNDVNNRDWFPKIDLTGGYIGDKYSL